MSVVGVRRHAERGRATPLTPRGEQTARALAGTSYALVVSSPLERAKRTAELVGGRLDATEPGLLPDIGGAGVFGPMQTLAEWRAPPPPRPKKRPRARGGGPPPATSPARRRPRERLVAGSPRGGGARAAPARARGR